MRVNAATDSDGAELCKGLAKSRSLTNLDLSGNMLGTHVCHLSRNRIQIYMHVCGAHLMEQPTCGVDIVCCAKRTACVCILRNYELS